MAIASRIGFGPSAGHSKSRSSIPIGRAADRNHHESADRLSSQNIELNRDPVALLVA